jgi:hypothetical protein
MFGIKNQLEMGSSGNHLEMVNYKERQSRHSQLGIVSTEGQIERVSILRDEENTKEICVLLHA